MTENLKSHIKLAKELSDSAAEQKQIDEIIEAHMRKKQVMDQFKSLFAKIVEEFLKKFQSRFNEVMRNQQRVDLILEEGAKIARASANETLEIVKGALYGK